MSSAFPLATYRLQLHAGFTFDQARAVLDYLAELGVTDVYLSPILRAEKGSLHGYNVCAYDQVSPELGGDEGFRAFSDEARRRGLRLLVDFVPNHMGIASGENAVWNDVLENGPSSLYADVFDIDWEPGKETLHARVLLPILGEQYGDALEGGKLVLAREGGSFTLRYYDHELPVAPRSLIPLLDLAAEKLRGGDAKDGDPDVAELLSVATATRNLPERVETTEDRRAERAREKEVIKRRIDELSAKSERARGAIDEVVTIYNGTKGDAASFDRLDSLLREQSYRLSYWRVASKEINYRRFFDVSQLAAVRMERPAVFEMAHARILALVAEGRIDGLRLDHTDGLLDPADYFAALRRAAGRPLYVIAEKILEHGERLPKSWEIDGTTGYDALGVLGGVWLDPKADAPLTALYRRFTGDTMNFEAHVLGGKRTVIDASFTPEMNLLARALERIAERSRRSRDFTFGDLREAIVDTMGAFPVYRTYVRPDGSRGPNDDRHIALAIALAKRRDERVDVSVFDFLREVLLMKERLPESDEATQEARASFAMRFQQMTGPIMAKGVEDTAFYRYTRFVGLNEVGGDPSRFGTSVRELHEASQARLSDWPQSLVATSTHDTKRGEDVRARLAVLTERPDRWEACVESWSRLAEKHRRAVGEERIPAPGDLYLLFQTVFGAWPFEGMGTGAGGGREAFAKRVTDYMTKALREAKVHGSWLRPNAEYEEAMSALVHGLFADETFVGGVQALADETATYAVTNALASVAVKMTSPGVPDTYQGCETWNLSLVDPDNRRTVDFDARRRTLQSLREKTRDRASLLRDLLGRYADGAIKLYVTHTLLALRREFPALHLAGAYRPIDGGDHVVAFTREHEGRRLACVVPRLPWTLTKGQTPWATAEAWGDRTLALPPGKWRNVLTGEKREWAADAPLREVLEQLPIAVLLAD